MLTELAAFIATTITATSSVPFSRGNRANDIASLFVAAMMLRAASSSLRDSGRIFLEAAPRTSTSACVGRRNGLGRGVHEVHDLHVSEVTSGFPALSAHVLVGADNDLRARMDLETMLHDHSDRARRSRSITRAETSSRSRSATELVLRPLQQ